MKSRAIDLCDGMPVYWAEYFALIAFAAYVLKRSLAEVQSGLDLVRPDQLAGLPGLVWEAPRLVVTALYGVALAPAAAAIVTAFVLLVFPRDAARSPRLVYRERVSLYWFLVLGLAFIAPFLLDLGMAELQHSLARLNLPGAISLIEWIILLLRALAVALVVLFAAAGLFYAWRGRPSRNYLAPDDQGLVIVRAGREQRWTWQELARFEVEEARHGEIRIFDNAFGLTKRSITICRASGKPCRLPRRWWQRKKSPRSKLMLQDIWDVPIEDIAAALNDHRDRASAGR